MADSPSYYVLGVEDPKVGYRAQLGYTRDYPLRSWMTGERFEVPPPQPIVLQLSGTDEKNWVMPDLWLTPITVMSARLRDALQGAGVDNLDLYATELHDPVSGQVHRDFVAFNLVGKIAAADRARTRFAPGVKERLISADIDSLVVDEGKTRGALMFRLAESLNAILIHDDVCEAIQNAGIETLSFFETDAWAG